jgi:hypothetical protein
MATAFKTNELKKGLETPTPPIQTQEISHLAKMINAPESLRLAIRICTNKPGKTKSSFLESPVRIRHKQSLDIRLAHLQNN